MTSNNDLYLRLDKKDTCFKPILYWYRVHRKELGQLKVCPSPSQKGGKEAQKIKTQRFNRKISLTHIHRRILRVHLMNPSLHDLDDICFKVVSVIN